MSPSTRRCLVIWNPHAGTKAGLPTNRTSEDDLRRAMLENGLGSDLFVGSTAEATRDRVRAATTEGYDAIVAAGGDGTLALLARELIGTSTPIGILPVGSAMNMARSLAIPRDLAEAARIVATGRVKTIDVGETQGGIFLEIASIGLNALILGEAHRVAQGRLPAVAGLVRVIHGLREHWFELDLDGRRVTERALMVAVANAPYTGLGLTLAPDARLDDGCFDVRVFRGFTRWELVRHLGAIVAGRRRYSSKVETYRAARVRIAGRSPLPARADDRTLGTTPVELVVRPAALAVIVPEP